jgi:hypothetical protein
VAAIDQAVVVVVVSEVAGPIGMAESIKLCVQKWVFLTKRVRNSVFIFNIFRFYIVIKHMMIFITNSTPRRALCWTTTAANVTKFSF